MKDGSSIGDNHVGKPEPMQAAGFLCENLVQSDTSPSMMGLVESGLESAANIKRCHIKVLFESCVSLLDAQFTHVLDGSQDFFLSRSSCTVEGTLWNY